MAKVRFSRNSKVLLGSIVVFIVIWVHVNSCYDDSCTTTELSPNEVKGTTDQPFEKKPYEFPPPKTDNDHVTDYCSLPRSSSREYNTLDLENEKYMMYSPAGGFNNQLMELLTGIILAKQGNRQLIVSVDGRHEHGWYTDYRKIPIDGTAPLDTVVDFEFFEERYNLKLIPLNETNKMFEARLENLEQKTGKTLVYTKKVPSLLHPPYKSLHKEVETIVRTREEPVVSIFGGFYTEHWIQRNQDYWQNIRYAPYLRKFALAMHARFFDNTNGYSAFHIRLGDYAEDGRTSKTSKHYLEYATKVLGLPKDRLIFIASDGNRKDRYFREFLGHFKNVIFSKDLHDDDVVGAWFADYESRITSQELKNDILGLVEQMLCVIADTFVGTAISTFSRTILANRNTMTMIPELDTEQFRKEHYPRVSAMVTFHGTEKLFRVHRSPTETETLRDKRTKLQRGNPA